MTPQIIPFEPGHMADWAEGDTKLKNGGVAFTAVMGETIVGCAGIIMFWPGVGEAWVTGWNREQKLALWFHRSVKVYLANVVKEKKLWRVQAHVPAQDTQARRWIEKLGFEPDGYKFHFAPDGSDCLAYYRLFKENLQQCLPPQSPQS